MRKILKVYLCRLLEYFRSVLGHPKLLVSLENNKDKLTHMEHQATGCLSSFSLYTFCIKELMLGSQRITLPWKHSATAIRSLQSRMLAAHPISHRHHPPSACHHGVGDLFWQTRCREHVIGRDAMLNHDWCQSVDNFSCQTPPSFRGKVSLSAK